jgi:hypothetical protein
MAVLTNRNRFEIVLQIAGAAGVASALVITVRYAAMLFPPWRSEWFSPNALAASIVAAAAGGCLMRFASRVAAKIIPNEREISTRLTRERALALAMMTLACCFLGSAFLHAWPLLRETAAKPPWDEVPLAEYLWDRRPDSVTHVAVHGAAAALLAADLIRRGRTRSDPFEDSES